MFELGTLAGRYVVEIPKEMLTTSVPGKFYHIRIETGGVSDEEHVANTLINGFLTEFKAKVVYVQIENGVVNLQLEGSPFAWAAVIVWLPSVFTLLGIALLGISIYTVFASIPSWAWGTLAVGVILLLLAPSAIRFVKPWTEE